MTFGKVIKALRKGKRASRASWQVGYIYLVPANAYRPTTKAGRLISINGLVPYAEYIACKMTSAPIQMWAPTHNDLLADDWQVW